MAAPNLLTGFERLDEIAEVIGLQALARLAEHYGGSRIYVPQHFDGHSLIPSLIGMEAAALLAEHFHRTEIYFPITACRVIRVHRLRAENPAMSADERARRAMVSRRFVFSTLAGKSPDYAEAALSDSRQPSLFDSDDVEPVHPRT